MYIYFEKGLIKEGNFTNMFLLLRSSSPGLIAKLVKALFQCAKVAGLIPG